MTPWSREKELCSLPVQYQPRMRMKKTGRMLTLTHTVSPRPEDDGVPNFSKNVHAIMTTATATHTVTGTTSLRTPMERPRSLEFRCCIHTNTTRRMINEFAFVSVVSFSVPKHGDEKKKEEERSSGSRRRRRRREKKKKKKEEEEEKKKKKKKKIVRMMTPTKNFDERVRGHKVKGPVCLLTFVNKVHLIFWCSTMRRSCF